MKNTLVPGLTGQMTYTVPENRTVPDLLPESDLFEGMPHVLATGYMVGILEWACMDLLRDHLEDDEITLGIHVDFSHDAPTVPGSILVIDVELVEVEGKALTFDVLARDNFAVISRGTHKRGVVRKSRFEDRLGKQAEELE